MMDEPKQKRIGEFKEGEFISCEVLLLSVQSSLTRGGSEYLRLKLSDRTGTISGKVWDRVDFFKSILKEGKFYKISGRVEKYQNALQLIIVEGEEINEADVDPENFYRKSKTNPEVLFKEVMKYAKGIRNSYLSKLVASLLLNNKEKLKKASAAKTVHHAYIGGLLEHILSMLRVYDGIKKHYNNYYKGMINNDLVVAGIILHDIGKIFELETHGEFSYSFEGKLLGHITIGVQLVTQEALKIKNFPDELKTKLLHLILSHHGELEYGSPVKPSMPEAIILHYIDQIDSKLNHIYSLLENEESSFSEYSKILKTSVLNPFYEESEESRENSNGIKQDKNNDDVKQRKNTEEIQSLF